MFTSEKLPAMNKDLKEERDKVPFDIEELTNWLYGGAEKVKEKRFLGNFTDQVEINCDQ